MSVDLLYDNKARGERVSQLVSQVATIKNMAKVNHATVTDQLRVIEAKIPEVLQKHGLKSVEDLRTQLKNSMTDEARKKYEDLVKEFGDKVGLENNIIEIVGLVSFSAGIAGTTAKVIELLTTGQLAIGMSYILSAVSTAAKDAPRAVQLLEAAAVSLKAAGEVWRLSDKALKAVKIIKVIGEVVAAVGLLIDGIILIIAAIEGDKQRTELEDAIHDLAYSRLGAVTLDAFGDKYAQYISSLYALMNAMTIPGKEMESIIQTLADNTCKDLKKGLEELSFDKIYKNVETLDKDQPPAYTGEGAHHPEPNKEALREWWNSGKAPDFRYKGKFPKPQ